MEMEQNKREAHVYGDDIPNPIRSFEDVDLGPLSDYVTSHFTHPTPVQQYIMPIISQDRDILVCDPREGEVLTACLISIIVKLSRTPSPTRKVDTCYPRCLILRAARERCIQLKSEAQKWADIVQLQACATFGGVSLVAQVAEMNAGCDILISVPGRLIDLVQRRHVSLSHVKHVFITDADDLVRMGFWSDIQSQILKHKDMPKNNARQTTILSSVFSKEIYQLALELLNEPIFFHVGSMPIRADQTIIQKVQYVENCDKHEALVNLLNNTDGRTIILVLRSHEAEEINEYLSMEKGLDSACITSHKSSAERYATLAEFESHEKSVLIITDAIARIASIPKVNFVINYSMPLTIEDYNYRLENLHTDMSTAISFFNDEDKSLAKDLINTLEDNDQEVPDWLQELTGKYDTSNNNNARAVSGRGRVSRGRGFGTSTQSTRRIFSYNLQ